MQNAVSCKLMTRLHVIAHNLHDIIVNRKAQSILNENDIRAKEKMNMHFDIDAQI